MPSPQGGSKKYCSEYTGMFRAQGYPKTGVLRNASVVHTTLLARKVAKSSCINILGFPVFIWKLKFRRQPQNLLKQTQMDLKVWCGGSSFSGPSVSYTWSSSRLTTPRTLIYSMVFKSTMNNTSDNYNTSTKNIVSWLSFAIKFFEIIEVAVQRCNLQLVWSL